MRHKSIRLQVLRLTLLFGLLVLADGCESKTSPMIDFSDAKPPVDLRRIDFHLEGVTVETLESDQLVFATENWVLSASPMNGRVAQRIASALGLFPQPPPDCDAENVNDPSNIVRIYRTTKSEETASLVNYLVFLEGHWIYCLASHRIAGEAIDIKDVDRLLLSARLFESPRMEAEVPSAWKEYQQKHKPGTPNGKFVIVHDPVPIELGSYEEFLQIIQSTPAHNFVPTKEDFQVGGRKSVRSLSSSLRSMISLQSELTYG